jgi:astacin
MIRTRWISWALVLGALGCSAEDSMESHEGAVDEAALPESMEPRTEPDARGRVTLLEEDGRLRSVLYEVRDGMAITDGDVVIGTAEEVQRQTKAFQYVKGLWTKRTVPYVLKSTLTATQRTNINTAIATWNNALGARTSASVVWKPRVSESDYVEFIKVDSGCTSPVGRRGGKQLISISTNCVASNIMHEMGHSMNLKHEHQRWDADDFIDVHEDRALTDEVEWLTPIAQSSDYKLYGNSPDFSSIMMYHSYAFAALNGDGVTKCNKGTVGCLPTLTKKGTENTWTRASTISGGDIKAVRTQYNVFENPSVRTSLAAFTPIRWFANTVNPKTQFCKDHGYTTAAAAESTRSAAANTVVATYNSTTRAWEASRPTVTTGLYTKITCKF